MPSTAAAPTAVRTAARWIDGPRPLVGWLSAPVPWVGESGVLLLPPVGYPYWSSHRTLRVIAERLAADGHLALRLDYDGTGDSGGDQWDPGRLEAWRASVAAGVAELRALGCTRLTLAGARLGGTLALIDGGALGADAVVAWAPVASGRRYTKELRLLSTPVPEGRAAPGTVVAGGTVFRGDTLEELASLGLESIATAPAPRVLVVGEAGDAKVADRVRGLGAETEHVLAPGGERALATPTEEATVPEAVVDAIAGWMAPPDAGPLRAPPPARPASALT